jgi:hypothetical protein
MSQTRRDSDIVKFSINHLPFVRSFVRSFPSLSPLSSTPARLRHELNTFGIVPGRAAEKTMPCKKRGSYAHFLYGNVKARGMLPMNRLLTTFQPPYEPSMNKHGFWCCPARHYHKRGWELVPRPACLPRISFSQLE